MKDQDEITYILAQSEDGETIILTVGSPISLTAEEFLLSLADLIDDYRDDPERLFQGMDHSEETHH